MADASRRQRETSFLRDLRTAFSEDRIPLAAAAVAFYLTLTVIPLLLLMISVAAFFISPGQARHLVTSLTSSFGAGVGHAIQTQLLSIVRHHGVLTGISLLVALWSGSQIFAIIESALNQVWNAEERRPFWIQRGLAILMVFVTGVLLLLAVGLAALVRVVTHFHLPFLGWQLGNIPFIVTALIAFLLPVIIVTLAFMIIYRVLPAYHPPWGEVFIGAVIAAVLWVITLQLFSWYTANFANYSALYGSLGELILLMLWFNYSAQIMLLGAEISAVMQQRRAAAQQDHQKS